MKKILTLVLALMMVLSMAATAEGNPTNWLCDEKTTLTVCTYDGVSQAFPTIGNERRFWQFLEEYTNVHIEWEVHSNADYGTVKAAKLAAGELEADIYNLGGSDMCNEAGAAGLLIDLTPYMETCMPNILNWEATENAMVIKASKAADGNMYYVGGTVSPDIGHICYMYNTHFFEQLGVEWPTTLDEFTEILRMAKGVDLNGNGEADEILLTSSGISGLDIIGNSFGCEYYEGSSMFAQIDDVVYSEHVTDETKAYWTYLNMLFEEGLLDPGIATNSADKMSQAIAADKVLVFVYYSGFATSYGNLSSWGQADPTGCHYALGTPLEGPDGYRYYVQRNRPTNDCTGISAACKNPELALKWLDTLLADPYILTVRTCGFEGETWEYDENGEVQLIMKEDGTWSLEKEWGCGQIAMPHYQTYDQMMNSKKHLTWYMDQYNAFLDPYMFIYPTVMPTNTYTVEEQDLLDLSKSDVDTYYKEMRAKFITGEADIATEWDSYVDNMYGLGLQDWIDAMQSYYDRALKG